MWDPCNDPVARRGLQVLVSKGSSRRTADGRDRSRLPDGSLSAIASGPTSCGRDVDAGIGMRVDVRFWELMMLASRAQLDAWPAARRKLAEGEAVWQLAGLDPST